MADDDTESDHGFTPSEVAQANALISGHYGNFVLVRATYRGEPICVIATVIEDGSETPTEPKFLQPHAVLINDPLAEDVRVQGVAAIPVDYDATPEEWREDLADVEKIPAIDGLALIPSPRAEDLWNQVNTMAIHAAETMGGIGIHSTADHRWCVHLGPRDPNNQDEGCKEETFLDALGHAMVHHVPAPEDVPEPGDPLLAEDDPRIDA